MNSHRATANPELTIVTGASSNHFLPLQSLLWTVSQFEPNARVIVYDLGLTGNEHTQLSENAAALKNWELRSFDFSKYPPHFSLAENSGRMAFRPTVLAEIAHESSSVEQLSTSTIPSSSPALATRHFSFGSTPAANCASHWPLSKPASNATAFTAPARPAPSRPVFIRGRIPSCTLRPTF